VITAGTRRLYHSGDTTWVDPGIRGVDAALLPINGKLDNLDGPEAARLAQMIEAELAIPCHYDMFEFNTVKPVQFVEEARKIGQPYQLLRCGERFSSSQIYAAGGAAPVLNPALAEYYTGKHILVGITYEEADGSVTEQIQFDGHIARINEIEGIVIFRRDTSSEYALPPDLNSLRPAPPGEYRLRSTGQVVKDPDLLTAWTIDKGGDEARESK
jgi:hypothetical protein